MTDDLRAQVRHHSSDADIDDLLDLDRYLTPDPEAPVRKYPPHPAAPQPQDFVDDEGAPAPDAYTADEKRSRARAQVIMERFFVTAFLLVIVLVIAYGWVPRFAAAVDSLSVWQQE